MPDNDEVKPQPDDKKGDEGKLTPAQQLELERLRAERAGHERTIEELRAKDRDRAVKDTFKREVEKTGIRSHHTNAELVTLLNKEEGVVITPSGDGHELHVEVDGKPSTLQGVLETYAVKHPTEFDQRTLRGLIDKGSDAIKSLADLPTREDRMAFIDKHGADAFARLGAYHPKTLDVAKLNAQDWRALSIAEKTAIVEKHGSEIVSKILRRGETK